MYNGILNLKANDFLTNVAYKLIYELIKHKNK